MHTDFTFCPAKTHNYTKEQIILPAGYVGNSLAGTALRSYVGMSASSGDLYPGLKQGLVQLPQPVLLSHNNIYYEEGEPLPMQVIRAPESDDQDVWLMIFSDRTALIAIEDPEFGGSINVPLMRVLPIVLRIGPVATVPSSFQYRPGAYKLSVEVTDGRGHLMITLAKPDSSSIFLLAGPYGSSTVHEHATLIQSALGAEISAWAKEIFKAPCLVQDDRTKLSGVFGIDRAAPDPVVEGKAFACPVALPQIHFTPEQFTETQRILHLAFVHLCDQHKDEFHDAAIRVCTAEPHQRSRSAKLEVIIRVAARKTEHQKIEKRMKQGFRALLKHPSVPDYVTRMTGNAVYGRQVGGAVSRTAPYLLYHKKVEQATSQHDRISAHAFFAP